MAARGLLSLVTVGVDDLPVIAPGTGPALEDPVDVELRLLAQATGECLPVELAQRVVALRAAHGWAP